MIRASKIIVTLLTHQLLCAKIGEYRSWNTTIKMAHGLPRNTKTYVVENYLCPLPSVRKLILRRYVQFVQSLMKSDNPVIVRLA